jgi:short-subunit dehydrogenase
VLPLRCDVTDQEQVRETIWRTETQLGPLDVLINNAGTISVGPVETMKLDDYERSMAIHFWGPLYATLAVLPSMQERGTGRIVNIASVGGKIGVPHLVPYCAGKFALVGFSRALRAEVRKDGVLVTTVCPGLMRTGSPRNADFKGQHKAEYAWFTVADSLPGLSMDSEQAARSILNASRRGDAEAILTLPAKLAVLADNLFPELSSTMLELSNRMLPGPGGIGAKSRKGRESESPITRSRLTKLTQDAARRNNQEFA